jgi:hypothetical protein
MTAGGIGFLAPAAHAAAGDTTTTFSISGGTLSMSVPSSTVNLGSTSAGSLTFSGQLGSTSVTDNRGALTAVWTATVTSTTFVTGGASANETVAKSNIAYSSGAATATTGTGTFAPGVIATLAAAGTGGAWAGVGVNSASWNPTLSFTLLSSQVAGLYTGTINQSVA